jgi:peptidyl-prolyl cis-trans isomerase B (cyclophilin B)
MEGQIDRRWFILAGFGLVAVVVVGAILISRGGGSSGGSGSTAGSCKEVEAPEPQAGSFKAPKRVLGKGEEATAVVETSCGTFNIALDTNRAPKTSNSFAFLAEEGFFDELTFHRVAPGFVIQGGNPLGNGYEIVEKPPADLVYEKGVVAMAKTATAAAGTSGNEFFVVTGEEASLPPEYALLGKVSKGMSVVETIGNLPVEGETPKQTVLIEKITIEKG